MHEGGLAELGLSVGPNTGIVAEREFVIHFGLVVGIDGVGASRSSRSLRLVL